MILARPSTECDSVLATPVGRFGPFLDFPVEIRKLIDTTNGIESLNARFRNAKRRGHYPNEQTAT